MWSAPSFSRAASSGIGAIEQSNADAQQRYDEIVELLLAAGYFRARIATLSPFDKVVGGKAWVFICRPPTGTGGVPMACQRAG